MRSYSISSYYFVNAKLSAIKSRLLSKSDYEALVSLSTVDEMIDRLEKTYYGKYIEELSVIVHGSRLIEAATNKWKVSLYQKLSSYIPKEDQKIVEAILKRYEIRNLKLLISAKIRGIEWEEVENLIVPIYPIYTYRKFYESEFKDILRKNDLGREIIGLKLSNLWKGKESIMNSLLKEGRNDIFVFSSLELYYGYYLERYLKPLSFLRPIKILLYEQDVKNLGVMFRFIEEQKGEEELKENLLEGGTLSEAQIVKAFKDENYRAQILRRFGIEETDIFRAEHLLFINLSKMKRNFTYVKPGLERLLGFFMLVDAEGETLGFIARAKEMGIDKESVWSLIV